MSDRYSLYLVRHAVADERGDDWPDDAKRPLTSRGIERFRRVVRGLAALDVRLDVILTSPLVRARQTADILAQYLPGRPAVIETTALAPVAVFQDLAGELQKQTRHRAIALVGHEPHLGGTAAHLIGYKGILEFKKGSVCRIDVDALPPTSRGQLRWMAPPKLLGSIHG
ncbi:MAG TPA: phosphohistidine phosphatase SixA [Vicinamibacterales bacterium]|jgi:phosphohistidine phosphatase